jgi:hypothetical protein
LSASFSPGPSWTIPGRLPDAALSKLQAKRGGLQPACADPVSQSSLPGPTLPYELTSLEAAGLSKMVWFSPVRESAPRKAGMFVSAAVASGFLAAAIAGVFYAMPTMARTQAPSTQQVPVAEATPTPAPVSRPAPAELEVTGVRFITDVPDQRPQIHYLVVNHTNTVLNGTLVNVTLRASGSDTPLSQFSFRTPRLGPYEYKEMVSTIERLNRPLELPDWRDVLAETELVR